MSQATVLRYLYALQDANYIYQEADTARYALTWRVCRLGENLNTPLSLRNIASPFTNRLANLFSVGSCLIIEQDFECLNLDYIGNPSSPTPMTIDNRSPMHATGAGKLLLSQHSEEKVDEYIRVKGLRRFTENTITDPDAFKQELALIRARDYATDNSECNPGVRCINCPLRDYSGRVIACIGVFGSLAQMTDQRIKEELFPALLKAATTISARLGYSPKA